MFLVQSATRKGRIVMMDWGSNISPGAKRGAAFMARRPPPPLGEPPSLSISRPGKGPLIPSTSSSSSSSPLVSSMLRSSMERQCMMTRRSFSYKSAAREAQQRDLAEKNKRLGIYAISIVIAVMGVSYASVPLYKVFCQATGFGGTTKRVESLAEAIGEAPPEKLRPIKIVFNADVSDTTPWKFWPTQPDILVVPGETALAFFTVKNKTDKAILGVATYNVHPPKAGVYFNKIQCFCFDEQRLKPKEEIDMPVFFFIDPEFLNDASMENVHEITLSYTFFKTDEDVDWSRIPLPQTPPHQPIKPPQPKKEGVAVAV